MSGPIETESEPYVRLKSLRQLQQAMADMNTARSLADTVQTIADGLVASLGYGLSSVHLVQTDGDLVVAAVAGTDPQELPREGITTSRETWDSRLSAGEAWGELRFVPFPEGRLFLEGDLPRYGDEPVLPFPDGWRPGDRLFAPLYRPGAQNELIGVLSVDRPLNDRRPGSWGREALQMYALQAAAGISNVRLRGDMQVALVRRETEQQALRASEESFRQAMEYAPSGVALAELDGEPHGRIVRANDALCRMLGRSASAMCRLSFAELVHPEDMAILLHSSTDGGRAEVRLSRQDGTHLWVWLRHSVVADIADGPRFLLTHVEDIEDRKRRELRLTRSATSDPLTGLLNMTELRFRLAARLCGNPHEEGLHHHTVAPEGSGDDRTRGLAVFFCDLDGMAEVNERFGYGTGDAVLIEVGRRLRHGRQDGDAVARYGGDEFVVLVDGLTAARLPAVQDSLRAALEVPMWVEGRLVRVGASLGSAWASCGKSDEEILRAADLQMYEEKRSRSAADRRAQVREIVPERRTARALPERSAVQDFPEAPAHTWLPQRPAMQGHFVRAWPTRSGLGPVPARAVEISSAEQITRFADLTRVHRLVCRATSPTSASCGSCPICGRC
ncbi:hypothetical protein B1R27_09795 [Streptomyces sp. GKU 895]|nr:hypothetical protein B1R27_09795 [Streptomyces sp. GKU 895]